MKHLKFILPAIALTLCGIFIFLGVVYASEVEEVIFTTDKAIYRESLINSGVTNVDYVSGEITKWFTGNNASAPEEEFTNNSYYLYTGYIAQVRFTADEDYTFTNNTKFVMNNNQGYIVNINNNGKEATVNFKVTLYYYVNFFGENDALIDQQLLKIGTIPTKPEDPTKEGYTFYGWYHDNECWEKYNFKSDGTSYLYACFIPNDKIIKDIDLTLTLPKIGTKFTTGIIDDAGGYHYQTPDIVLKSNTENVKSFGAYLQKSETNIHFFTGVIKKGQYYYFNVEAITAEGYKMSPGDLNITINGTKITKIRSHEDDTVGFIYKKVIAKAKNPLTIKKYVTVVKYSKLKQKNQIAKPILVTKKQGTLSYEKISGYRNFVLNKKTGAITVKKGTKKGLYKVKVKIKVSGNELYNPTYLITTAKIRIK